MKTRQLALVLCSLVGFPNFTTVCGKAALKVQSSVLKKLKQRSSRLQQIRPKYLDHAKRDPLQDCHSTTSEYFCDNDASCYWNCRIERCDWRPYSPVQAYIPPPDELACSISKVWEAAKEKRLVDGEWQDKCALYSGSAMTLWLGDQRGKDFKDADMLCEFRTIVSRKLRRSYIFSAGHIEVFDKLASRSGLKSKNHVLPRSSQPPSLEVDIYSTEMTNCPPGTGSLTDVSTPCGKLAEWKRDAFVDKETVHYGIYKFPVISKRRMLEFKKWLLQNQEAMGRSHQKCSMDMLDCEWLEENLNDVSEDKCSSYTCKHMEK